MSTSAAATGTPTVAKVATGIPGFDDIALGGLPRGRPTLVAGSSGSGKTIFAAQFLVHGLREGGSAVFVTFEETPADIRSNLAALGWDIARWEDEGRWIFVDAAPLPEAEVVVGSYNLEALLARILHAVASCHADRLVIDSVGALLARFPDPEIIRGEVFRIVMALKDMGLTSIVTTERTEEYGRISRSGMEEFVSDNVVVLRNVLEAEIRARSVEILKFRGAPHCKGEHPFTVLPGGGIAVVAPQPPGARGPSAAGRISSGIAELDAMCCGGFHPASTILVSGASGSGKTVLSASFVLGTVAGERALLICSEEDRAELLRNLESCGLDLEAHERAGLLRIVCTPPEAAGLIDHLMFIRSEIEAFRPARVALDSLSTFRRITGARGFRQFLIQLSGFTRHCGITFLFSLSCEEPGERTISASDLSTVADTIVLLRYVELFGEIRRGIAILKMRGSGHDKGIREFIITEQGIRIGRTFRNLNGILAGHPSHETPSEEARMDTLFGGGDAAGAS